jgi:predicted metal-dependent peptidase
MTFTLSTADRLAAAKLWLISASDGPQGPRDLPYLAHAIYALIPVLSTEVARVSVDEHWRLYVNEQWAAEVPLQEFAAELVHLTWHLLYDHAGRARDMKVHAGTAQFWHSAADAAIEGSLRSTGLGLDAMACPGDLHLPEGLSAEEYYAKLSGLPVADAEPDSTVEGGCGSGSDGLHRRHELPSDVDVGAVGGEDARQIRHHVAIAFREHVTQYGGGAGGAWRWAKEILEPTIAWEPILASAVRRALGWTTGRAEYTYTRRSRRQSALPNVVLPGTRRPVATIAFIIDTSGSVDDQLLSRALGEVDGALRSLGVSDSAVTVLACDAAVLAVSRVRSARDTVLAGGGGTDMRVGIRVASELKPRPDVIVVFTDGYTPWPAEAPAGCVVVAAMLGREQHEFPPSPRWAVRIVCTL